MRLRVTRLHILFVLLFLSICLIPFRRSVRRVFSEGIRFAKGRKTVADRIDQYGTIARSRWEPKFLKQSIEYPPDRLVIVGIKDTETLQVWASRESRPYRHIHTFPILAASGRLGPKLKEGDYQVPEGVYHIESLNPNSMYHLSLRLNYPNAFDLEHARKEGRDNLGTDIMIHGKACSIGCLAMGDEATEDLFVLAMDTGLDNIQVILTPVDFRVQEMPKLDYALPDWIPILYNQIREALLPLRILTR